MIAAWDGFLRTREMWIQKADVLMKLYSLQRNIEFEIREAGGTPEKTVVRDFYEQYDKALAQEHQQWLASREKQAESVGKPKI